MKINKSVANKADYEIGCSLETEAFRKRKSTVIVSCRGNRRWFRIRVQIFTRNFSGIVNVY